MQPSRLLARLMSAALLLAIAAHGQTLTILGAYAGGENDASPVNGSTVTSALDTSGNAKHLSPTSDPSWSTVASPGAANFVFGSGSASSFSYYFDGDDGLSLGSPLTTATSNWGMEAWVRLNSASGTQSIMLNGNGSDGYGLIAYNGNWNGLLGGIAFVVGPAISAGTWTHLAFVRDTSNASFYVNGAVVATHTTSPGTPSANFLLGADLAGNYMQGYIDQARVFTYTGTFNPASLNYSAIPEPSTYALIFGAGVLGLAAWHRRRAA